MINRLIVISTMVLATSLAVNWVLNETESSIGHETYRNNPDVYMLNATISKYNHAGTLNHTLSAARFTHFPLTDLTTMKKPEME